VDSFVNQKKTAGTKTAHHTHAHLQVPITPNTMPGGHTPRL